MSRRYLILTAVLPALVAIICFVLGFLWVLGLPPTYSSKATIAFEPRITKTGAFPSSESVILYASNSLGYLTSDATMAAVASKTGQNPRDLAEATEATVIPGTATIAIEVREPSAEGAARAANTFAEQLLAKSAGSPTVAGELYGKAKQEETASGPPRTILTLVIAVLSLIAGLLTFTAMVLWARVRMAGGLLPALRALTTPARDTDPDDRSLVDVGTTPTRSPVEAPVPPPPQPRIDPERT